MTARDLTVRLSYVCCGRVCSGPCPSCGKVPGGDEPPHAATECHYCGSVGCGCPRPGRRRRRAYA